MHPELRFFGSTPSVAFRKSFNSLTDMSCIIRFGGAASLAGKSSGKSWVKYDGRAGFLRSWWNCGSPHKHHIKIKSHKYAQISYDYSKDTASKISVSSAWHLSLAGMLFWSFHVPVLGIPLIVCAPPRPKCLPFGSTLSLRSLSVS